MCGFIGVYASRTQQQSWQEFEKMTDMITHRGPDDVGYYEDEHIQLGFRRLSIIDLEGGHQPLTDSNERYLIVFNGEIYNYVELRDELLEQGYEFATHSDTEVILALYSVYGVDALRKLRGMFAFVIWDKVEHTLFGARDPFGIKPFYYCEKDERLYFGSERKSIALALQEERLNEESLQHYLTFQFVPEPLTVHQAIYKLEPGHYFIKQKKKPLRSISYWKAAFTPLKQSEEEVIRDIRKVMEESVRVHMRSDVPVGAFLSSGLDSTTIVALARQIHPGIKTFSVGFEVEGYNEIDVAKETAEKLGVENIHYLVRPEEFIAELPKIIWHMDEPLADPSAIPLYFIAREASKHVTVVLSGEGADELFGGYNIYREPGALKIFSYMPNMFKRSLKSIARIIPEGVKGKSFIERGCTPLEERFIGNAKIYDENEKEQLLKTYAPDLDHKRITKPLYQMAQSYDDVNKMQYIDIHTWLRGDILLKADKMTMAHSLELRVPFLDKDVFDVASRIETKHKITHHTTKYVLREAMRGIVPDHVLNRKKLGFPVPIRVWLKDELYDWAKQTIKESETDYLFEKSYLLQQLETHRKGKLDDSRKLWTVLIFMLWHQIFIEKKYHFFPPKSNKETTLKV